MPKNTRYEILTPEGFKDFTDVVYKGYKKVLKITTNTGKTIKCTSNHKIFVTDDYCINAKFLKIGDKILGDNGQEFITDIESMEDKELVFDIVNVGDKNRFYANGITVHNCLDEFAFIPRNIQEDFMASAFPTINSGNTTKVIMITTPNGNEKFHQIYTDSQRGLNSFVTHKVIWSAHPKRDEKWKKETIDAIGIKKFRIEHECEFEGSAATVISGDVLNKLTSRNPITTKYLSDNDPECVFHTYEDPKPDYLYWIQVDPGEGIGEDFTTIQVIKLIKGPPHKYEQVAVWKANDYNSELVASIIFDLANKYNQALVCVEVNGLGASISDKLWDKYEYENLIFTRKNSRFDQTELLVGALMNGAKKGIYTTNTVKLRGTSKLERNLGSGQLILHDKATIEELSHFVKSGSTYKAESGFHDDLVMPLVLFSWVTENNMFNDIIEDTAAGLSKEVDDEEYVMPIVGKARDNTGWDPLFW